MTTISRRGFLKAGGGVAASVTTAAFSQPVASADADVGRATLPYVPKRIGKATDFAINQAAAFTYPDDYSPCALIKAGARVPGGVGPDSDIVAYSTLCTHMGCPVLYDEPSRTFRCPCHFSTFDAEMSGQMVCGQATEDLPTIVLQYDAKDDSVFAVGVRGLIYGRQSNLL